MNEKPSTAKIALKWGAVAGITTIIYQTILFVTGMNRNQSLGYVTIVFTIGGLYLAIAEYKRENGGYLSIGEGVGLGVLTATIMGMLSTTYSIIYMTYIDPNVMKEGLEIARQQLEDQGNMTDDQIDQAMEMSQKFTSPGILFLGGLIWSALSGAILSLIISAIVRREPVDPFSR
ncbi:DUF4199 domain-containing protein [Fibrella aquatilis]|uniref:DUF4199 domain-containing protein n=1 Tax=Fibrella aquatilis TaxID=2817059 RepID=A0A939G971_9BACT|nr:DUF4199 domain-containing protein [Fibrella aquatilis]MBO0933538.1 DUF4199 domain-containing protein [Fibrella aquatilis]